MTEVTAAREPDGLVGQGRFLFAEVSLPELLQQLVSLARHTVAGADGVSVSLDTDGGYETPASTDELVRELDHTQYRLEQGPCVHALESHELVCFRVEDREPFPEFADAASAKFITAVMSTPLTAGGNGLGALNMYSGSVPSFPADQVETARLFAEQAAIILANGLAYDNSVSLNARLQEALLSRDVIGQAKGLIMARESCSGEEAFGHLRLRSQQENRKLRTLAEEIVAAHEKSLPA